MEEPLELLVELIGLFLAQIVDPRLVARERGHLQRARECGVVDLVELELEEDQVRGDGGDLLLDVAVELRLVGIGGVGGIEQAGVGAELADGVAQALIGGDRLRQRRAISAEGDELALIALLDVARLGGGLRQIVLDRLRVRRGIEVCQVPHRHRAQVGGANGCLAAPALIVHRPLRLLSIGPHPAAAACLLKA